MARRATRPLRQPTPHPSGATPPNLPAELVPNHVAIVMDGNGRWAKERGLPRIKGHEMGEASLLDCVHGAIELGISHISAYAFSTENWKRSPEEVKFLMGFNRDVIRRRRDEMNELGVRVRWAGRRKRLWKSVIDELETAEEMTRANTTHDPDDVRQLRRPSRDRRRCAQNRRRRSERSDWIRTRSPNAPSRSTSTSPTCPTSICSSAPPASSAPPTS